MSRSITPLKIVIVGDNNVGKTHLLYSCTKNKIPDGYIEYDLNQQNIVIDDKEYAITLWDTTGYTEHSFWRSLCYPNTDCILLCYSISDRSSFENILRTWYPEIKQFLPNVPIILIGTKCDLRTSFSKKFITSEEGIKQMEQIKAFALIECSAKKKLNLKKIFHKVVYATKGKPGS